MRIDPKFQTRQLGPLHIFGFAATMGGLLFASFVLSSLWILWTRGGPPDGEVQVAQLSTYTPSPTLADTQTPQPETATETAPSAPPTTTPGPWEPRIPTDTSTPTFTPEPYKSPTPTPLPTGWLLVPANPTPIPTPILPAAAPFPADCNSTGRINVLVIGVDGRGDDFGGRSDSIMVVGINVGDRSAQVLSIPRDLYVQIPEYGSRPLEENRINTAFPRGGADLLIQTIGNNLGLRIDRWVIVNFTAFVDGIDAIGGVDVYLNTPIHDEKYPMGDNNTMVLDIPAGWVHMDGEVALMYARTRHQDSDFGRMKRQQKLMMAVRQKLLSPEVIPALPALAELAYSSVRSNLTLDDLALMGCVGPQIPEDRITQIVIDRSMTTPYTTPGGANVVLPNMDMILPALTVFNEGE